MDAASDITLLTLGLSDAGMTRVFTARHPTEAHLIANMLSARGIRAEVRGEALFSTRGEVPVTASTLPSVWVIDEGQVTEALALLRDRASTFSDDQPWTCPRCGESVESQFTQCWNCGAEIPLTAL